MQKSWKRVAVAVCLLLANGGLAAAAWGVLLTVHQIQSNTSDGDASSYDYQVVDCTGGIVVAKFAGYRPRLILQDPAYPDGWGAIQVKDWIYPFQMFYDVHVSDWVEFTNVLVEEFRGTTFLQRQAPYSPGYHIVSRNNPLPPPVLISVSDIPAPVYDPDTDGWYVENHQAEVYESMRLIVRDVTVSQMDLGKAVDNYSLQNAAEECWAADYMNADVAPSGYHPFVNSARHFCAVAGVLEQYTDLDYGWDYYQLVTTQTMDLAICGDGNSDGQTSLADWVRFDTCLIGPLCNQTAGGCNPPAWTQPPTALPLQHCLMMDCDYDGDVDLADFGVMQKLLGDL